VILIVKSHSGLSRIAAFLAALIGAACLSLLAGCGQKGPLYLPGTPAKPIKATGMPVAPAASAPVVPAPSILPDSN